ncbi:hypothetical protein ACFV2N_18280 [Streptomyces sp. NPDC059680]|uniref:hypothetical protein n=1 Tax=Streptomyces sp. NPDC059680 TaxID=3346904 RepID=UPI0036A798D4
MTTGFGQEDLRPVYLSYRLLSMIGGHASLQVLDELFDASPRSHYVRISAQPAPNDMSVLLWDFGLYYTSIAAEWVLSAAGFATPESTQIREWSVPLPNGRAPWLEDS